MKVAFIVVLFHTEHREVERLKREIKNMKFKDYHIYFVDNTRKGRGYASGVNEGIHKAIKDNSDLFILCNPDISLKSLSEKDVMTGEKHFDIWGLAMKQENVLYYGGEIDKWRKSGGLIRKKPNSIFLPVDFVSGSFMCVNRKTVEKIGMFDESYFMYYEDVDYCERARRAKLRVGIDTKHSYLHFESSKTNKGKTYLLAKNRLKFLFMYGDFFQKIREFIRIPKTLIEERSLIFYLLFHSPFLANFFSLNISGLISKFLNLVLFIFLVRFLPIREYGIYTLVWAHVNILSPLVDFGTTSYGMVYLPREKKEKVFSLFSMRLILSLIIFALTIVLAYVFHYQISIIIYILLTSFVIFYNTTSGMYLIMSSIEEKLVHNSLISVLTNILMMGCLVMIVMLFKKIQYVFFAISVFYILYTFFYSLLLRKMVGKFVLKIDIKSWIDIIKKSYVFVLVSFFAGIYFKIDVFILNYLKGAAAVGVYSSGYKFFEAMIMLASSYNTLSAPIFSKTAYANKRLLFAKVVKHTLFLGTIGGGVVCATLIFGSIILPHILKGNYEQAIPVVKIVIWALPFILFNSVLLKLLYASDLTSIVVALFLVMSIVNISLNFLFVPQFSFFASSYITVFSEIVNLLVLIVIVFVIYRKKNIL